VSVLQTTIWDIRKLLTLDTVTMAQTTATFSVQFEEPVVTRAAQNQNTKPVPLPLMPPFAASFLCNCRHLN
jgi:hypothetical protein